MSKTPHGHPSWLKGLPGLYSGPTGHTSHGHAVSDRGSPRADESARLIACASEGSTLKKASDFERKSWLSQIRQEVREFFLDTKLNYLLVAFPFAIISKVSNWGDGTTFSLSMIALCPLAERLGFITEQLAMYTNDTLGGLLNASFGNATEVIISGFALQHGYVRVVQLSLLGSVVSNLLLVMGTAFLAGGIRHSTQSFNQQGINVNCALLLLGTVAVVLPSLLSETKTGVKEHVSELALSRFESLFLLMMYCCYLLFQLYTHRFLYEEDSGPSTKATPAPLPDAGSGAGTGAGTRDLEAGGGRMATTASEGTLTALGPTTALPRNTSQRYATVEMSTRTVGPSNSRSSSGRPVDTSAPGSSRTTLNGIGATSAAQEPMRGEQLRDELITNETGGLGGAGVSNKALSKADTDDSDDGKETAEEEEEPVLSKTGCFIWLTVVTACIALLSEWIISAIEGASRALKMPMPFLVTILLPIVGNAAEHASAVVFAWKNRIEIALGVAVGSSTQVAVLVVPFTVVLAWCMGQPLDLNFNAFEASVYFISVLLAIITVQDGTANWLKGVLLLVTYVLVAAGFWWHKDADLHYEDVR